MVALQVADLRLHGTAALAAFLFRARQSPRAAARTMYGGRTHVIVAAITFVDVRVGHTHAGVALDRRHRSRQRVAVVRVPRTEPRVDDPVAAVGRGDRHLLAKLVPLVCFPFADAEHFRLVQAVELTAVGPLLRVQAFAQREQFRQRLVRFGHTLRRMSRITRPSHVRSFLSWRRIRLNCLA